MEEAPCRGRSGVTAGVAATSTCWLHPFLHREEMRTLTIGLAGELSTLSHSFDVDTGPLLASSQGFYGLGRDEGQVAPVSNKSPGNHGLASGSCHLDLICHDEGACLSRRLRSIHQVDSPCPA